MRKHQGRIRRDFELAFCLSRACLGKSTRFYQTECSVKIGALHTRNVPSPTTVRRWRASYLWAPAAAHQHVIRAIGRRHVPFRLAPLHKAPLCFQLVLCLSRACLGKMIAFMQKIQRRFAHRVRVSKKRCSGFVRWVRRLLPDLGWADDARIVVVVRRIESCVWRCIFAIRRNIAVVRHPELQTSADTCMLRGIHLSQLVFKTHG